MARRASDRRVTGAGAGVRAVAPVLCPATSVAWSSQRRRVGYWLLPGAGHVRWRSARPLWGDASFASVAPVLSSGAVLAAVRSATVGMPLDESAAAPFTDGHWLLSHNGRVERSVLPPGTEAESVCDSALLAAQVFARGPEQVADTVRELSRLDPRATLNLLLTNGTRILAVTWGDPASYLVEPDGVVVASEPWDEDPRWVEVPDRRLLEVGPNGLTLTRLED